MYRITYGRNGIGRSMTVKAESDGEAMELFDEWADCQDDDIEFIGIKDCDYE